MTTSEFPSTATASAAAARTSIARVWVPQRRMTAVILLVAGVAVLATTFSALPPAVLAVLVAAWAAATVLCAQSITPPTGFLVMSICIKAMTLVLIGLLIFDRQSAFAPHNGLYWIPLGLLNMGSGLWFLRMIRKKAA